LRSSAGGFSLEFLTRECNICQMRIGRRHSFPSEIRHVVVVGNLPESNRDQGCDGCIERRYHRTGIEHRPATNVRRHDCGAGRQCLLLPVTVHIAYTSSTLRI
jgi:hypothetical protein